MKVMYQGKEIEIEEATDEEMSLDYHNPVDPTNEDIVNLEDTMEFTEEDLQKINDNIGDQNE